MRKSPKVALLPDLIYIHWSGYEDFFPRARVTYAASHVSLVSHVNLYYYIHTAPLCRFKLVVVEVFPWQNENINRKYILPIKIAGCLLENAKNFNLLTKAL